MQAVTEMNGTLASITVPAEAVNRTMRAAVYKKYGGPEVVKIATVPKPVVAPGTVLVRVKATTVTSGDWRLRSSTFPYGMKSLGRLALGVFGPRNQVLGAEYSGDVEAVGAGVTHFKVGDAVAGGHVFGCHAEYILVSEKSALVIKPAAVSYEHAACLAFGANTALSFLRDQAKLKAGDKILVIGASGSVGSAAVQIAKYLGASEITAVCSGKNADLVKSLGADKVIDYEKDDFTKNGETYDIIFDTTGARQLGNTEHSLNKNGRLCMVVSTLGAMIRSLMFGGGDGKRACAQGAVASAKTMTTLVELLESGKFRPVIDREFSLADIVEAHKVVDQGHKKGNVVIKVPTR
jgi:NADPH:quinone reductase-like Zn-dependent oxidoreductase